MSEDIQLSNRQKSLMISIGLSHPPGYQPDTPKIVAGNKRKNKSPAKTMSMKESDIKWRAVRKYIREYFLNRGYDRSDYKKMYKDAQDEGVDLECFKGRNVSLRSFATHALRVRIELGMPSIRRGGLKKQILNRFELGLTEKQISDELKCSRSHVYNTLRAEGKFEKRVKRIY